jgi:hypothetical protein
MDFKFDYDIFEQLVQLLVIGLIIYFFYYYANGYTEKFNNYDDKDQKKVIDRSIPVEWINTPFGYGFGDMNPAETLPILIDTYGPPDMIDPRKGGSAIWYKKSLPSDTPFESIEIKDEQIPNDKPYPHTDFIYTSYKVNVPEHMIGSLHKISKSITYDPLKKIMTARNFDIKANVVTHWIVKHFALGKLNIDEAVSMYGPMNMEILADPTGVKYRELLSEL